MSISQESRLLLSENKENVDEQSITEMINMLKEYEKLCITREDFNLAEETKNKIAFLQVQREDVIKKNKINFQKEGIQEISKEGQEEIKKFQHYWDNEMQVLVQKLKETED